MCGEQQQVLAGVQSQLYVYSRVNRARLTFRIDVNHTSLHCFLLTVPKNCFSMTHSVNTVKTNCNPPSSKTCVKWTTCTLFTKKCMLKNIFFLLKRKYYVGLGWIHYSLIIVRYPFFPSRSLWGVSSIPLSLDKCSLLVKSFFYVSLQDKSKVLVYNSHSCCCIYPLPHWTLHFSNYWTAIPLSCYFCCLSFPY